MLLAGTSQRACLRRVSCWFFCGFLTLDHISCRCSTGSRLLLVDILLWSWVLLPVDAPLDCLTSFNWKQQEVNKVQVSDVVNLNFSKQHLEEKKNQKENLNSFYPESNWGNEKKNSFSKQPKRASKSSPSKRQLFSLFGPSHTTQQTCLDPFDSPWSPWVATFSEYHARRALWQSRSPPRSTIHTPTTRKLTSASSDTDGDCLPHKRPASESE